MAAVTCAVFLVRINREIPLILGVVLGMGAFIVLQWEHAAAAMLSLSELHITYVALKR